jgi:molybdopterin converting factor small subunit
MRIEIRLFGHLEELAEARQLTIEFPGSSCTVGEAADRLSECRPELEAALGSVAFAIADRIVPRAEPVHDGDVLALLPPFSGG